MAKIAVIIGSTREGRATDKLAKWVAVEVSKVADVETIDLRDYDLPFFNEAIPPRYNPNRTPVAVVQKWIDTIETFDGYVIATPEYNRSVPGVLKNALDSLGNEMVDKPVAIVAHGSTGGAQAVASLRVTLPGNGAFAVPNALFFTDGVGDAIDEEGILKAELQEGPYSAQANLEGLAKNIAWYADALKTARQ